MSFLSGKKHNTCIEIDRSYLKIVYAEVSSKDTVISKIITLPITGLSNDEISKTLSDAIATSSIKLHSVDIIISREKTMVRYLKLPAQDPDEIEDMISFEASKQIPYAQEEIISDYSILGTDSEGYTEIMLVVAHKNEANKIDEILKAAGVHAYNIRLSSEAIARWLYAVSSKDELGKKNICLVDIDNINTEIAIISNGILNFSRVASVGSENMLESESARWMQRLVSEIKNSISMYIKERAESSSVVSEFLITGSGSCVEEFTSMLKVQLEEECKTVSVLSMLNIADGALGEEGVTENASVSAVCGGLFIGDGINLIEKEAKKRQKISLQFKQLVSILILSGVIIGVCLTLVFLQMHQKKKQLGQLKAMLKSVEPQAKALEDKIKKVDILKSQLSEGTSSLDVLYNLYKLIPSAISLLDFNYDDTTRVVRFRGKSQQMSDVFKLVTILEGSDKFSKVETRSVVKRRIRRGEVVDFQIRCNFAVQD